MTDATTWLPLTPLERRTLAIHCIATMYQGLRDGDDVVDVYDLLIETSDAVWSASTATGDAMFLPGQWGARFEVARKPERNIYFAGEHLSYHHTWISGAANSALYVVKDMLKDQSVQSLRRSTPSRKELPRREAAQSETSFTEEDIPELATVPFQLELRNSNGPKIRGPPTRFWPPTEGDVTETKYSFPTNLGVLDAHAIGAKMANLKAPGSTGT